MISKKVINHSLGYLGGELALIISGFISFPILTRLFTIQQYGELSLIGAAVGLITPIACFGAVQSLVRFFHKYKQKRQLNQFINTYLLLCISSGTLFILLCKGIFSLSLMQDLLSENIINLLPIALGASVMYQIFLLFDTVKRMEEKILNYNIWMILNKYIAMAVSLIAVLIFASLYSFYVSQLNIQLAFLLLIFLSIKRSVKLEPKLIVDRTVAKELICYGLPLAITSIAYSIYDVGDKFVIAYLRSPESVAVYSVAYTIYNIVSNLIASSINFAVRPAIFRLWEAGNERAIKDVVISSVKIYYLIAFMLVFIVLLSATDIVRIVASQKYTEAAKILPVLIGSMLMDFSLPFSLGLHFKKKTIYILYLTIFVAFINIVLNFILIPPFDIKGAAYATLGSRFLYFTILFSLSQSFFKVKLPYKFMIKCFFFGLFSFSFVYNFRIIPITTFLLLKLMVDVLFFISLYGCLLIFFDIQIRNYCKELFFNIRFDKAS